MPIFNPNDNYFQVVFEASDIIMTGTTLPTGFDLAYCSLDCDEVQPVVYCGPQTLMFDTDCIGIETFKLNFPPVSLTREGYLYEPECPLQTTLDDAFCAMGWATFTDNDGIVVYRANVDLEKDLDGQFHFDFHLTSPITFKAVRLEINYKHVII